MNATMTATTTLESLSLMASISATGLRLIPQLLGTAVSATARRASRLRRVGGMEEIGNLNRSNFRFNSPF